MGASDSINVDDKLYGFRVYKITEGGPLHLADVRELEDFIIPPEEIINAKIPFYDYIKQSSGKKIKLNIYSLLKRHFYNIEITPNLDWSLNKDQGYLGASVRYENWSTAEKCLLRVINVRSVSLAQIKLKLIPAEEFIIAIRPETEDILTLNKDYTDPLTLFSNYLTLYKNKNVEFFIYNCKTGARREIINLNDESLGCDVAYGKLHEFPKLIKVNQDDVGINDSTPKVENLDSLGMELPQKLVKIGNKNIIESENDNKHVLPIINSNEELSKNSEETGECCKVDNHDKENVNEIDNNYKNYNNIINNDKIENENDKHDHMTITPA